ncbi:cytidine deaminase [Marinilactibacillus sp. 15R]|uniref:Cytidine deaminase n=1 Tax=Marinilactibacillus piezotolerans TaxID=258723 RepID=A0A1I3V306_9LACT|nr:MULTISPECIES: cytidine deaminase [Marinilactibacillus]API89561.1 cytidine deaminase [Marinilactibacillus sp. 15R]SFJ89490.1 cytidine deaminase [Marinilactibacillus piezotolerans]
MNENQEIKLIRTATDMLERAYVPYSKFPVGASLLTKEGTVYSGCNIENASFGLTNCAERTAIFKAVSEGEKNFEYLVVTGDTDGPISPCGACRQVMAEFFSPEMKVLLTNRKGQKQETTVQELLPGAFTSKDMV